MDYEPLPEAVKLVQTLRAEGIGDKSIETLLEGMRLPTGLKRKVEILFGLAPQIDTNNETTPPKDEPTTYNGYNTRHQLQLPYLLY